MKQNEWHDIGLAIIDPDNHAPMKPWMKEAKEFRSGQPK